MNTINVILSILVSLALTVLIMPFYIKALKQHHINQSVSEYALDAYKQKEKTPIMGGLIFVIVPIVVFFILNYATINKTTIMVIISFIMFASVGFWDDILIILRNNNEGLSPKFKLVLELVITVFIFFLYKNDISCSIELPFLNGGVILPWYIFLPFMVLLYSAEANAVNFTDGMDGLCAGVSLIGLIAFSIIAFKENRMDLFILILCVCGGLIGYLFFNFHPAKIFMGDSGSLALGALFASIGIALDKEIALFIIGGVFVIEMFCVCLQLLSVKLFHKRVFSYTPIHYAFVLKGHKEVKIVIGFYIVEICLALIGLFVGLH